MKTKTLVTLMSLLAASSAFAQVSYSTPGSAYTQNFSSLSTATNVSQTWTNNETIEGWYARQAGGDFTAYTPAWQSGVSAGVLYHLRNTEESNRSFLGGRVTSGTGDITMALRLTNDTGSTLDSFSLSFLASQFHKTGVDQQMQVDFSTNATSLTTGTWTNISSLTYTGPYNTGNAQVSATEEIDSRQTLSISGQSINWANGDDLWIRWVSYRDLSGEYTGGAAVLAINDVSFAAIPEPGTLVLLGIALGSLAIFRRRR